jgi:hypothetical protein
MGNRLPLIYVKPFWGVPARFADWSRDLQQQRATATFCAYSSAARVPNRRDITRQTEKPLSSRRSSMCLAVVLKRTTGKSSIRPLWLQL